MILLASLGCRADQCRVDSGTEDALNHRHTRHPLDPRRRLAHPPADCPGRNQLRTGLVSQDPASVLFPSLSSRWYLGPVCSTCGSMPRDRVWRSERSGSMNVLPNAAGSGPTGFGCGRFLLSGATRWSGLILRHDSLTDRQRRHRFHLRPQQHHRRRSRGRLSCRRTSHICGRNRGLCSFWP